MVPPIPLTRREALEAWSGFASRIPAYAQSRNAINEGHGNVSRLGAAIRFRLITEDEIITETLAGHSFPIAEKWIQEVCWRRYWKGWLEKRPQVWSNWRLQVAKLQHGLPPETLARIDAVAAGRSGVACMDHIARELIETGYLHNHARMWWASFWIHVERLPWELGANFFFRHLLDADPASNTLSWRWVAGLQTPGKTYLVRLSNIRKYAPQLLRGNEARSGRLADDAVTACCVEPTPVPIPQALSPCDTSLPLTTGRIGLWLHPDDLTPEVGPLADLRPVSAAACISDRVYHEIYQLSARRMASLRTMLRDGLTRTAAHYDCPALALEQDDPVAGLCDWAKEQQLSGIVALTPMVGPIHDMLGRLRRELASMGILLTLIRRPSDEVAFSFASAGFFPFWQKMSSHLRQLLPP